ncbi:MAG: hypothetical protein U7127_04785 [Phormidium sp.]
MKNSLLTKLLNLPGVIVESNQETEDTLILFVKSEKKTAEPMYYTKMILSRSMLPIID